MADTFSFLDGELDNISDFSALLFLVVPCAFGIGDNHIIHTLMFSALLASVKRHLSRAEIGTNHSLQVER